MAWGAFLKFGLQVVGSFLLSSLLAPNVRQTGSRLEDKSVQTSTYGTSVTRIHGTCGAHGNALWLKGNQLFDISVTAKGKKTSLFGSRSRTTVFPVFATFAIGLCEGPIAGIRRLWIGSDLVYDAGSDDIEAIIASNQRMGGDPLAELPQNIVFKGDVTSVQDQLPPWTFKIYYGTEDQEPSIAQEADKGVGNVPAYRGIAYIEIYNLPLEKYGNSLAGAQVKAEIVKSATTSVQPLFDIIRGPISGPPSAAWDVFGGDGFSIITNGPAPAKYATDHQYFAGNLTRVDTTLGPAASVFRQHNSNGMGIAYQDGDFGYEFLEWGTTNTYPVPGILGTRDVMQRGGYIFVPATAPRGVYRSAVNSGIVNSLTMPSDYFASVMGDAVFTINFGATTLNISAYDDDLQLVDSFSVSRDSFIGATDTGANAQLVGYSTNRKLYLVDDVRAYRILEIDDDHSATFYTLPNHAGRNEFYAMSLKIINNIAYVSGLNGTSLRVVAFLLNAQTAGSAILSDVVSEEVQLSNYISASDIDVTSLTDEVRGYRITDTGSIRSSLEPLQAIWPFDVYQTGYKLKFVRRGNASVVSIPASKLDARPYGTAPDTELNIEREMDSQLPREVALKHLDAQREYDIGEQRAERKTTDSINKIELEIPVSLTATEAAQAVEVMLWMAWGDRHNVSFSLPPEYGNLEPTDVITITGQWGVYTLRLGDVDYKTDGRVVCTNAKFESAASYVSNAIGSESGVNEQTLGLSGPSFYQLLDIPMIADEFNGLGTLTAMAGYTSGWPGGVLYRSSDNGATWDGVLGFQQPVTVGFATNAIGVGRTDIKDFTNALTCTFIGPIPSSISYAGLLDWGNVFAYGSHGRWEIIGVQTVTAITGGYRLTDMLRGMFGTEWAMDDHEVGDRLVLLSTTAIQWLAFTAVDETLPFLGITSDRDLDTDTSTDFTYEGVNLTPLSPVYLNGNRHPSTNDWTLTWLRRFRYSLQFVPTIGTPANEDAISFEIDVFSNSGYTTVLRTIAVTAATASYTSAQQVTDFGSNQSTLYLEVYAISATVGRGYALRTSITR